MRAQQTTIHLVRYVGLTEDEILKISFETNILKGSRQNEQGKASTLYFEYKDRCSIKGRASGSTDHSSEQQ